MKTLWILVAICLMAVSLTACETMKGFGKDVESAGEWMQKKAN